MPHAVQTSAKSRNNTLDLLRVMAFCGIVVLHTIAPDGLWSRVLNVLARFGVPYFFAISGFFSLSVSSERLVRRIERLALLVVAAVLFYLVTAFVGITPSLETCLGGPGFPALGSVVESFFIWNAYPPAYPLWFLFALMYVYVVLIAAQRFGGYRTICIAGGVLLVARVIMSELGAYVVPLSDPMRSWLFTGVPCFALGLWMRNNEQSFATYGTTRSMLTFAGGCALALLESHLFGLQEMYIGSLVAVVGAFAFAIAHPLANLPTGSPLGVLRDPDVSTIAYIVHYAFVMLLAYGFALGELACFAGTCVLSILVGIASTLVRSMIISHTR